ncbi:MAG: HAD hydrolase-like protein, partial [Acidobacteriota bacterium]
MKLLLFDIDGTLIRVGGAARRALERAIEDLYGYPDSLEGIQLDGKTDQLIVREALEACGVRPGADPESLRPLFACYLRLLDEELAQSLPLYRVMPGVESLLADLAERSGILVGLATGNIEEGARIKLGPSNLNRFFGFGGFGSDAADRTEVIRAGIAKAQARDNGTRIDRVIVVGDTPRDIIHGHAAGAEVIAVCTGSFSSDELK